MASETIPQASDNGGAWGFSKKDAARIARIVKRVEAQYYNTEPARSKYPIGSGGGTLFPAKLTAALTVGTLGAPTSATADRWIQSPPGVGFVVDPHSPSITVYNTYNTAVPSGKTVWCTIIGGNFYVIQADC